MRIPNFNLSKWSKLAPYGLLPACIGLAVGALWMPNLPILSLSVPLQTWVLVSVLFAALAMYVALESFRVAWIKEYAKENGLTGSPELPRLTRLASEQCLPSVFLAVVTAIGLYGGWDNYLSSMVMLPQDLSILLMMVLGLSMLVALLIMKVVIQNDAEALHPIVLNATPAGPRRSLAARSAPLQQVTPAYLARLMLAISRALNVPEASYPCQGQKFEVSVALSALVAWVYARAEEIDREGLTKGGSGAVIIHPLAGEEHQAVFELIRSFQEADNPDLNLLAEALRSYLRLLDPKAFQHVRHGQDRQGSKGGSASETTGEHVDHAPWGSKEDDEDGDAEDGGAEVYDFGGGVPIPRARTDQPRRRSETSGPARRDGDSADSLLQRPPSR